MIGSVDRRTVIALYLDHKIATYTVDVFEAIRLRAKAP